jgi:hypothetical protein
VAGVVAEGRRFDREFGAPLDDPSTIGDGGNDQATGFSILEADSKDAVDQLLRDHPHLHTPGGTIVVHEFLPVPGT